VDSKKVCHVNSSACRVYVTSFYSTTSISFYKSFYTFSVFIYFLQLHFRGHFRVHFCTSTSTFICGRTATFLFYTYTHLWMYSGLYSATATFARPFSCTFSYIHVYIHLWTHSDVSILHLHSSVDVQRSLQCYSYIFAVIFVYIFVHPRRHSSVDEHRRLCSIPTLICGCTVVSTVLQLHFRGHFCVHFCTSTPTFIPAHHLPCFQGGKECMATLHSSDRDFTLLYILYILHLRLTNIFAIQASIYVLHSTSTFRRKHFRKLLWVLNNAMCYG
jgi:hypothetical protein